MDLITLCRKIDLQEEMQDKVMAYYRTDDFSRIHPAISGLRDMETEACTREELVRLLGDDPQKVKMLACMLVCALELYPWYQEKGIGENIFFDTMRCFTRFIEECRQKTGQYAFDREWWTARQVSGVLFRIGELEYEMVTVDSAPAVSIHIPSDAVLTGPKCDLSLENARKFFAGHFPRYDGRDYICDSWLLAPELGRLLLPDSNIIGFQRRFRLLKVDMMDTEYMEWVFKTRNTPAAELPEDTSLQRNIKQHLLDGGKIGAGCGILI